MNRLNDSDIQKLLPRRVSDSHKGSYGRVLVIAGSNNMAGACILTAKAALHTGCGLVKVLTPKCNRIILQTSFPEGLLSTYGKELDGTSILSDIGWADAIAIGPGLGTGTIARRLVAMVLKHAYCPVVYDADALNIISQDTAILDSARIPPVITPHLMEMSRLTGKSIFDIKRSKEGAAAEFSKAHSLVCHLKDFVSYTSDSEGNIYENTSGNDGMATAGSGDVLTGIIASLLAQGMDTYMAAVLGAYMHGRAGDFAAEQLSARYMTASDIYRNLSKVFKIAD